MFSKRITYVTGKGGVGKTSVVAALGVLGAQKGRRVLIAELGADGHLQRLLGQAVGHAPRSIDVSAPGEAPLLLDVASFDVSQGLARTLGSFVPVERIVRAVVQNRVLQLFLETAPSVQEAVLLDELGRALHAGYDNIFVDLPASGHALTMLQVPSMIVRLVKRGPIAKKAEALQAEILTPKVAQVLLVALPEPLAVQETIELTQRLRAESGLPVWGIVLNGTMGTQVSASELAALEQLAATPSAALSRQAGHLLSATRRDESAATELAQGTGLGVHRLAQVTAAQRPLDILRAHSSALASFLREQRHE